ncbi:hypothetical protein BpHYR1_012936 [Brachionus plicatilis]|uniref:DDE-1 domain-containing protein n=1 Tax=Brachionus plicatilis TaxID=10195 RepID=A0A3M7SPC5_BRAPC|nr:hypothetical protein BpHYR1_012936 [Brachionus plicatilis]
MLTELDILFYFPFELSISLFFSLRMFVYNKANKSILNRKNMDNYKRTLRGTIWSRQKLLPISYTVEPRYNETLLTDKLECIEFGSTPTEIDIKNSFFKIKSAWDEVTALTIRNCFNKSGFSNDTVSPNKDCEESDTQPNYIAKYIESKKLDLNQFAYVKCDENVPII